MHLTRKLTEPTPGHCFFDTAISFRLSLHCFRPLHLPCTVGSRLARYGQALAAADAGPPFSFNGTSPSILIVFLPGHFRFFAAARFTVSQNHYHHHHRYHFTVIKSAMCQLFRERAVALSKRYKRHK